MTDVAKQLVDSAMVLTEEERLQVASELITSVDGPADADWDATWLAELERRCEAADSRGETADDWKAVRGRILSQIGK